jgi:hypothetical protein
MFGGTACLGCIRDGRVGLFPNQRRFEWLKDHSEMVAKLVARISVSVLEGGYMMFLAKRETRGGARGHVYAFVYQFREISNHLSTLGSSQLWREYAEYHRIPDESRLLIGFRTCVDRYGSGEKV